MSNAVKELSIDTPYGIFPGTKVMAAMLKNPAKAYILTLTHNFIANGPAAAVPKRPSARLATATPSHPPINMSPQYRSGSDADSEGTAFRAEDEDREHGG